MSQAGDVLQVILPFASVATLTTASVILRYAYRIVRQNEETAADARGAKELALELKLKVKGDNDSDDERERGGVLGRLVYLEGREEANTKSAERNDRRTRAILRGLGVPSDLSDDRELQQAVRDRVSQTIAVDRNAARLSLVDGMNERIQTNPGGYPAIGGRIPTGQQRAYELDALAPPVNVPRPSPPHGHPVPREDPPSDKPPPRRR